MTTKFITKRKVQFLDFKIVRIILSWAAYYWYPSITNSETLINNWLDQINQWERKSGAIWTIARVKDLKLIYTRYISGEPFRAFPGRIGLYANGLPKATKDFNALILKGDNESISFVLTLLSVSRAMEGIKDPDLSTITDSPKYDETIIEELGNYIPSFCFRYDIPVKIGTLKWTKEDIRLSNKAGPEGRATLFSWRDAALLTEEMLENIKHLSEDMYKYLVELRSRVSATKVVNAHRFIKGKAFDRKAYKMTGYHGHEVFMPIEEAWRTFLASNPDKKWLRKLSLINDPEAKARIIAILDFWSQEVLKPLHDHQFKILRTIPKDRTFTQDPIITDKEDDHSYHSLDLSAATDRFPIAIQEKLIAWMMSDKVGAAWKSILIDQPYAVPFGKPGQFVKYATGQPMGAYSSWSTFTLSHHLVVNYAAHLAGITNFDKYILLGDDIVIYNDDVAQQYKILMARLGVGISPHKTHTSKTTYEFAKRWFRNGSEITGIQVRGFIDGITKYHLLYAQINELYKRGRFPRIVVDIPHLLLNLYKRLGKFRRERNNLLTKVKGLHAFTKFIQGANPDGIVQHIKEIYKDQWYHLPTKEDELNHFILQYIYNTASSVIQKASANALSYNTGIKQYLINNMSASLADAYTMTPPQYLILLSPITQAIRNRLKTLAESLSNLESGSVKDMIQAISLPDPSMLEQRKAVQVINTTAQIANKFFVNINEHLKGRPVPYQENLSSTVVWMNYTGINQMLMNHKLYRNEGYEGYHNPNNNIGPKVPQVKTIDTDKIKFNQNVVFKCEMP